MSRYLATSVHVLWVVALIASLGILFASLPGYLTMRVAIKPVTEFTILTQAATWLGVYLSLGAAVLSLALACLLVWKKGHDTMALTLSFFLLLYGIIMAGPLESFTLYWLPQNPDLGTQLQSVLFPLPSLILTLVFPNGRFVPRWTRGLPLLAVLLALPSLTFGLEEAVKLNTLRAQVVIGGLWLLCFFGLGIQVHRYRKLYTPVERQQTKWVVYGTGLWIAFLILSGIPYSYLNNQPADAPTPWWSPIGGAIWWLSMTILPLSFTLAILRSRLWDIDFIIHRTVTYALLTALLVVVYFSGVVILQRVFVILTGQRSDIAIILSTLAIAGLSVPLRNRIQTVIDRRFFRTKFDAQRALEAFALTARDEVAPQNLMTGMMDAVEGTMQPERMALWLRDDVQPHKVEGEVRL